jgi:hypothetical protein
MAVVETLMDFLTFSIVCVKIEIKSKRLRWAGHVTCVGERRGACRGLVGRCEGKTTLG